MTDDELAVVRRAFARQLVAVIGAADNAPLEAAFRTVPRERFLGSDPWTLFVVGRGSEPLPANDPVYAYQDVLFTLSPARGVNNGAPSLHARLLTALSPRPGQTVVHLGAGSGYYAAILAELVGPDGHVSAVEIDPVLGRMARENLSAWPNVEVIVGDGGDWPRAAVDRVYVNFAVTAPPEPWIERLAPGGRLVFPLGVPGRARLPGGPRHSTQGGAFLIERGDGGFPARHLGAAYFVHAEGDPGHADDAETARLDRAFRSGGIEFVKSLAWRRPAETGRCWFWSPAWSLSYDPV